MTKVEQAIQEITYRTKKFPGEAFKIISENKKEALPYLRSAIEKALIERDELEETYDLHFYAFYLLGEFQDKASFPKILEMLCLPGEIVEYLLGDAITMDTKDIVYNVYDGNLELLKSAICNEAVDAFVRSALLDVMAQLYLDGTLNGEAWKKFLKQLVYCGKEESYLYSGLAGVICRCHFVEMLSEIRFMLEHGLMDEMVYGDYDSCVDYMFEYRDYEKSFCTAKIDAAQMLKGWVMFEKDKTDGSPAGIPDFKKMIKEIRKMTEPEDARKIGRNDPCPCGSGKKYKFCCLNQPQTPLDKIENVMQRKKCLERYPYVGAVREEGKVYLEDYFDAESIEIDKLLYLGLMHRMGLIWERNEKLEEQRTREYLCLAFEKFTEKVQKENIKTLEEYDRKFSIHYFCADWLDRLLELLKQDGNRAIYSKVKSFYKQMGE